MSYSVPFCAAVFVAMLAVGQSAVAQHRSIVKESTETNNADDGPILSELNRATTTINWGWTEMTGAMFSNTEYWVTYWCNAYSSSSRGNIASAIFDNLRGSYGSYKWNVVLTSAGAGYGMKMNTASGTTYDATCNGNTYTIWGVS